MPRYQRKDDPVRRLAERHERGLKRSFLGALRNARKLVPVKEVANLLRHGRRAAAVDAITWAHLRRTMEGVFNEIGAIFHAGALLGAAQISRRFRGAGKDIRYGRFHNAGRRRGRHARHGRGIIVRKKVLLEKAAANEEFAFDLYDDYVQELLRDYQDELIKELEAEARDTIETVVAYGAEQGWSWDTVAASIRDSISLTDRQAQAVENFRRLILEGDPATLDRALRDKSFDNILENVIDGEEVSDTIIDQMIEAYSENYLTYRAETIARTESLRAASMGLRESYSQAIDDGVFPAEAVLRFWQTAVDERTCPVCLSIPDLNEDGIAVDDSFDSDDGPIDDPPVHPSCRCSVRYETDLDMVPRQDEAAA